MAYVIVWQLGPKVGQETAFEIAYGLNGDWVQFFRFDPRYIRTELIRDIEDPRRYFTLDYWASKQAYDEFRAQHEEEYKRIDAQCEGLTESEELIGRFFTVDSTQAT